MSLEDIAEDFGLFFAPWRKQALCRGMPTDMFFTRSEGDIDGEEYLIGLGVCKKCPVQEECLDEALRFRDKAGIRGGKTAAQRKRIKRRKA